MSSFYEDIGKLAAERDALKAQVDGDVRVAEVVRVLAEREGLQGVYPCDSGTSGFCYIRPGSARGIAVPDYLRSRDALTPVLENLTDEEWVKLRLNLIRNYRDVFTESEPLKSALTIPARRLAFAIAEAIRAEGGK